MEFQSLSELLTQRAASAPDEVAFIHLRDDGQEDGRITNEELQRRALAAAGVLAGHCAPGARVLLLFPPGLEFIVSLFACFHAGGVAVPAPPPHPRRLDRTLPRLLAIAEDAGIDAVLAPAAFRSAARQFLPGDLAISRVPWLAPDDGPPGAPANGEPPRAGEPALIQYTSGSTANPRGVVLTHRNLLVNSEFIARSFAHTTESRGFMWLPPYHDMGLIGGILQPVYVGFPCVVTSPFAVVKRPMLWLEGISRFKATSSGGPNFGYDMCVRRADPTALEGLDLSCWETAISGAEPVRADTIDAFSATFGPCGFRRSAFLPCYGLAEATLMVTGSDRDDPPVVASFDAAALESGRALPPAAGAPAKGLVACGGPARDHDVAIVDPRTRRRCAPHQVGEVWVTGPSVGQGYWGLARQSAETFRARLASDTDRRHYLRTGDLGVVRDGQLYVAGRLKDALNVNGRNLYPDDIEHAAESSDPRLRPHSSAAFDLGEPGVGLVLETGERDEWVCAELISAARRRVADLFGLHLHAVVLVAPGKVPKTTSGKIQRQLCKAMYDDGRLDPVAERQTDLRMEVAHELR